MFVSSLADNEKFTIERMRLRLTKTEMAKIYMIHPQTYYAWESGRYNPTRIPEIDVNTLSDEEQYAILRKRYKLSCRELGRRLKVAETTIYKMEKNLRPDARLKDFWHVYLSELSTND